MEVVAYLRVSGRSQLDGDGFPRQLEAAERCCRDKNFILLRVYQEEAVPGKLDEEHRPAFQEMIADLLSNGCRAIVVEGLHRLAREYRTQEHLIIYLASKGLTLISADTGEDITAAMMGDPMRRALVQIQGIFAELEKNMLVAKLAKARQRKKIKDGVEKGYSPEDAAKHGKGQGRHAFGEKPKEVATLERIREWRGTGATAKQIAEDLNAWGYKSRSGKPWRGTTVAKIVSRMERQQHA
jgi:DNA invertase Pin-like site-specific DNA recombinase